MKLSMKMILIILGFYLPVCPLTMAENAELAAAIARGPLNMASLYAEARHKPETKKLKIVAHLVRVTNDLLSIMNHKNEFNIDYFHGQQIARMIQSSISLMNTLRKEEGGVDFSLFRELLIDACCLVESMAAMSTCGELKVRYDLMDSHISLQLLTSYAQGCAELLRDVDWSMKCQGKVISSSFEQSD